MLGEKGHGESERPLYDGERANPICAYLGLFPSLPTPPLCHLLLSVRTCTGSLLPPSTRGRFLMDPTPWTATQKPMQVVQARLETGLRPSALHLLPKCIQPSSAQEPAADHRHSGRGRG